MHYGMMIKIKFTHFYESKTCSFLKGFKKTKDHL